MLSVKQILAPTDFSPVSRSAVYAAAELCETTGAELFLLHTAPAPAVERFHDMAALPSLVIDETKYAWDYLSQLPVLADTPHYRIHRKVTLGDPRQIIPTFAREHRIDLIVMGTRERAEAPVPVLDSVAEAVLQQAPCPVLTIPAEAAVRQPASPFDFESRSGAVIRS